MGTFNYSTNEYTSSRSVDKLQFDVNKIKLGQLPGLFERIQHEGGFFKKFADMWKEGENYIGDEDEGLMEYDTDETLEIMHIDDEDPKTFKIKQMFSNMHWLNPAFEDNVLADIKGGMESKSLYGLLSKGHSDEANILVFYEKDTGTVIGWEVDVD